MDLFVDLWSNLATLSLAVWDEIKDWAVLNTTTVGCAGVHSFLQVSDIPTIDKVAVVSISSRVAHRPDEWPFSIIPFVLEITDAPDDFVEERDQVDRVCRRA